MRRTLSSPKKKSKNNNNPKTKKDGPLSEFPILNSVIGSALKRVRYCIDSASLLLIIDHRHTCLTSHLPTQPTDHLLRLTKASFYLLLSSIARRCRGSPSRNCSIGWRTATSDPLTPYQLTNLNCILIPALLCASCHIVIRAQARPGRIMSATLRARATVAHRPRLPLRCGSRHSNVPDTMSSSRH